MKISGLARRTYYYHLKRSKKDKYAEEKSAIAKIFHENKGRYGYRWIELALHGEGYFLNHKTVYKLMKSLNLKGKRRKNEKYHSYKGEVGKIAGNLLARDFHAEKPFKRS